MVLQRIIRFYEERLLGRKINEAEQEDVRAMCEEFRRLKAPGGVSSRLLELSGKGRPFSRVERG